MTTIPAPYPYFTDAAGNALEAGKIYIGTAGLDPRTNPIAVYQDEALTIAWAQPIRTVGGYPVYIGAPSNIQTAALEFSLIIATSTGEVVFRDLNVVSIDAANVAFIQAGVGAVARSAQDKLRENVSVKDFGAVGDGTTNDTAAIQAAIDSLGAAGGTVTIPNGAKCLIDTALTVKPNVSLVGPHQFVGSPDDNANAPYGALGGALIVNSAVTITLQGGTTINGLLVYRKGMTFPASTSTTFAGTAFTVGGDDASVTNCMVLGFDQAFNSVGWQRPRLDYFYFDCEAGVYIENCLDNPHIGFCHAWPFSGIATISKPSNWADRVGPAYHFKNTADWLTLTACFSYGYNVGTKIEDCNHYLLLAAQADGTTTYANSIGIVIDGTAGGCEDGQIIAPRVAAQTLAGIKIQTQNGVNTTIVGGALWNDGTHGVWLVSGDLHISDTQIRDINNGITVDSANSNVFRHGVRFDTVTLPINAAVVTNKLYGGLDDYDLAAGNSVVGGNARNETIASAAILNLPTRGEIFNVTGTTNFGSINGGWAGRRVTFIFSGILSVLTSTGASNNVRLSGAANYTSAANSTLTIAHNGVQWFEVGRTA